MHVSLALVYAFESDRHATSIMFDASVLVSVELALKTARQRTDEEAKSIIDNLKSIDRRRQQLMNLTRSLYMDQS
jgi:hypothetical protein